VSLASSPWLPIAAYSKTNGVLTMVSYPSETEVSVFPTRQAMKNIEFDAKLKEYIALMVENRDEIFLVKVSRFLCLVMLKFLNALPTYLVHT